MCIRDRRYLGQETPEESSQITIPKDEPETSTTAVETTAASSQPVQETEPISQIVKSEMENYQYTVDDLNTMYASLRYVACLLYTSSRCCR